MVLIHISVLKYIKFLQLLMKNVFSLISKVDFWMRFIFQFKLKLNHFILSN